MEEAVRSFPHWFNEIEKAVSDFFEVHKGLASRQEYLIECMKAEYEKMERRLREERAKVIVLESLIKLGAGGDGLAGEKVV